MKLEGGDILRPWLGVPVNEAHYDVEPLVHANGSFTVFFNPGKPKHPAPVECIRIAAERAQATISPA